MPPPERLYVYEVQGRVNPPVSLTEDDFLGCWREGDCSYLFFSRPRGEEVRGWLAANPGSGLYLSETELNYADWEAGQPLKPLSLAGFHLCPIWEEPTPNPGELVLRLEPGLAFGSGYHPTTKLCLTLLRRVFEMASPKEVLDLGTGTGVLALAALALGARRVVAVEYNELAVRTAARNLRHNQRTQDVLLIQGDARHFAYLPGDLVLANIHLDVLLDLVDIPSFLEKQCFIFSGILGAQIDKFRHRLKGSPLKIISVLDENMWFTVLAENPDAGAR